MTLVVVGYGFLSKNVKGVQQTIFLTNNNQTLLLMLVSQRNYFMDEDM